MKRETSQAYRGAGWVRTAVISAVAIGFMWAGTAMAAGPFTLDITSASVTDLTVTLSGTADSPAGQQSGNYVRIDWGDGSATEDLPNFEGSGPWAWGPVAHTYGSAGSYTITATLLHSVDKGNDASEGAIDTELVDVGDDTDDTDDSTDDSSDDSTDDSDVSDNTTSADDDDTDDTEVLGTRFSKSTPKNLATTGPEDTATILVLGLLLMAMGLGLRRSTAGATSRG